MSPITALRNRLRQWLGINQDRANMDARLKTLRTAVSRHFEAGLELGFKGNTRVVILSKLGGGRCEILDCHIEEPHQLAQIFASFHVDPRIEVIDAPMGYDRIVARELKRHGFDVADPHNSKWGRT